MPHVYVVGTVGIVFSLFLMFTLHFETFIRLIFFTYARSHTKERFAALEAEAAAMDEGRSSG